MRTKILVIAMIMIIMVILVIANVSVTVVITESDTSTKDTKDNTAYMDIDYHTSKCSMEDISDDNDYNDE